MNCPLCKEKNIKVLEKIDKHELVKLYTKITDIDFGYLVTQNIDFCECQNCKLRFYNPLITGDEKFYSALQKFDWYYMDEKEEYHYAKKYIGSNDKVLEVGSGKGAFTKHLTTKNYIGLDFSQNAKEMAAKNGVTIENEMVQDYALKHAEEFDVVVSFQVLEHVSDPKEFLEAKLSALKKGGKLIVAVPSEDTFLKYVTNGILNMPPHHVTRWSDATFDYIAQKYNLDIETIYHEKVQEVHKLEYMGTLISNSISKNKIIETGLVLKIKHKFSILLSKFIVKNLENEMLPNGHSVLVVFKKVL